MGEDSYFDEQKLRMENAQLKEEVSFIDNQFNDCSAYYMFSLVVHG